FEQDASSKAEGHRTGRFNRFRFPQMDACALRRRLRAGAGRREALADFHHPAKLSAGGRARAFGWWPLVLRVWPRTLSRFSRVESVVHSQDVRCPRTGRKHPAELPASRVSGQPRAARAATRTARAGRPKYRLLPFSPTRLFRARTGRAERKP